MKRILFIILICVSTNLFSQEVKSDEYIEKRVATIGILQGGGSLIGADLEFLLSRQFGFQVGLGYVGFGAGLNYHFVPSIRSSFVSLQYCNQGIGKSFYQNIVGTSFVYRAKKWFTFQIGLGVPLTKGPGAPKNYELPSYMLIYSIGAYFPF